MSRTHAAMRAAIGLVAFLALWEVAPRIGLVNASLVPPPSEIPAAFWREVASGIWLTSIVESLSHYLLGLIFGSTLGASLGIATGMFLPVENYLAWVIRLLRPVPGLAWIPFAIIWFGVTPPAAVFIITIAVFWIVYFAAHGAVRAVDRDLIEVADAFGFRSAPARLIKIVLPAAAPGILIGVRTALGQAWMAVVASEIFGVPGLGQRMVQASALLATDIVVVYMLTMAVLYGVIDSSFTLLQSRMLQWKR